MLTKKCSLVCCPLFIKNQFPKFNIGLCHIYDGTTVKDELMLMFIVFFPTYFTIQAISWGRDHEDVAAAAYESMKETKTRRCGFYIDPTCCWLGASPDRVVTGDGSIDSGLVEIKCPLSAVDCSLEEFAKNRSSCLHIVNDEIHLKRSHSYYYQVLGQMATTHNQWCDFVVWSPSSLFIERIHFDEMKWIAFRRRLTELYFDLILPQL